MGHQLVYLTIMFFLMILPFVFPGSTLFCLLFGGLYTFFRYLTYTRDVLPMRLPSTYGKTDYADPIPGPKRKFFKAQGRFFLGNERNTLKELWIGLRDLLTHILIYGSTGAGKTEQLVSMAFNFLAMGGGVSYIDAKAAKKLGFQIYALTRFVGRDHDFRVMNYGISEKSPNEYYPKKVTNTNNPLNFGSAESLTQFVAATIKTSSDGNAIFGQNAQVLVTAAMYGAVELRDSGRWQFDISKLRELLTLPAMLKVVEDPALSRTARNAIKQFLISVGWQEGKPIDQQGKNLNEQFGYARAYFGLFLASLSDTYGHIYKTKHGEVDQQDILKNRRIQCIMIPSVEKTPQETENIGQINLSGLKNALVSCLGTQFEGTVEEVLDSLPIDLKIPFASITDEHAAIQTPGYEIFLTQGRGFGVCAIIGTQDRAGLYKADEFGAQQIEANTKLKGIGAMDDPKMTWELARELAGETTVMQTSGSFVDRDKATSWSFQDQRQTQVSQTSRVDIRDFQEQIEGQFHLFFRGRIIRGLSFFADPSLPKHAQLRVNDMLPVPKPEKDMVLLKLETTQKGAATLAKLTTTKNSHPADRARSMPVKQIQEVFDNPGALPDADLAICAFKHWVHGEDAVVDSFVGNLEAGDKVELNFEALNGENNQALPAAEAVKEPEQKEETNKSDPFAFAPTFAKQLLDQKQTPDPAEGIPETDQQETPATEVSQAKGAEEIPPDKNLYQGFKTLMESTTTLFNDQAETIPAFKKDWVQMEKLCGASPAEAGERSERATQCMIEASRDVYPDSPPPEKPGTEAEQQMADYMSTLLNEVEGPSTT